MQRNNFRKETNMAPCEVSHPRRATATRHSVISVNVWGRSMTSRTWRCSRRLLR